MFYVFILGFKAMEKVCFVEDICVENMEFGEATSVNGVRDSSFDALVGLALAEYPDNPSPFTQSVSSFN